MRFLFKTLFRTAVIGTALSAAVVGGTAMLVGPERVGAMADQVQGKLQLHFDENIDDPVAMRRQIAEVAREYPERIRAVRGDLHTLQEEVARLEREQAVSRRVVALVDHDLELLVPAVAAATRPSQDGAPTRIVLMLAPEQIVDHSLTQGRLGRRHLFDLQRLEDRCENRDPSRENCASFI